MRLMKRILSAAAVLALSASLLVGCSSGTASSVPVSASSATESTVSSVEETASSAVDENEAAAAQLLNDLTGSYQELWPVILADEYKQTWLDVCTALVGEDNAEAAFEKLSSMVTGDVYGEDAVEAYANGGGAYFCGFTNSLATLTFDGETSTISGTDKDGNVLLSLPHDRRGDHGGAKRTAAGKYRERVIIKSKTKTPLQLKWKSCEGVFACTATAHMGGCYCLLLAGGSGFMASSAMPSSFG